MFQIFELTLNYSIDFDRNIFSKLTFQNINIKNLNDLTQNCFSCRPFFDIIYDSILLNFIYIDTQDYLLYNYINNFYNTYDIYYNLKKYNEINVYVFFYEDKNYIYIKII